MFKTKIYSEFNEIAHIKITFTRVNLINFKLCKTKHFYTELLNTNFNTKKKQTLHTTRVMMNFCLKNKIKLDMIKSITIIRLVVTIKTGIRE